MRTTRPGITPFRVSTDATCPICTSFRLRLRDPQLRLQNGRVPNPRQLRGHRRLRQPQAPDGAPGPGYPGTLVPEEIRWIPATTEGNVERIGFCS